MTVPRIPLPFRPTPAIVGMIHLPPLPGSPGFQGSMDAILRRVEPWTVAALTRAVARVRDIAPGLPVGVNVLRNDPVGGLGVASATGASFIRVNVHTGTMYTDQGPLQGRAWETVRLRARLGLPCAVLADVHVKHATPVAGESLEEAAGDTWHRGRADALVVSGGSTGSPTDPERIRTVRAAAPEAPVWVGSGTTPETLPALWPHVSGFIVGSFLLEGGRAGGPVDPRRAREFMEAVERLRSGA